MKTDKLQAVNAKQEEFETVYREVIKDYSDFKNMVVQTKQNYDKSEREIASLSKVILLIGENEDEDLQRHKKYLTDYLNMLEEKQSMDAMKEAIGEYEKNEERADRFIEQFKEEIQINDDNTVVLGSGALLMLEYVHTIRKVLQEDDKPNQQ